jgi:hypothetical protein
MLPGYRLPRGSRAGERHITQTWRTKLTARILARPLKVRQLGTRILPIVAVLARCGELCALKGCESAPTPGIAARGVTLARRHPITVKPRR